MCGFLHVLGILLDILYTGQYGAGACLLERGERLALFLFNLFKVYHFYI